MIRYALHRHIEWTGRHPGLMLVLAFTLTASADWMADAGAALLSQLF